MRLVVHHTTGPIAPRRRNRHGAYTPSRVDRCTLGRGERLTPGRGERLTLGRGERLTPGRGERKIRITLCTVGTVCILFSITLSVDDILYISIHSLNSMQESRSISYHLPLTHQIFYSPTEQWYYSVDEPRPRRYVDEPRPRRYVDEPRVVGVG
jgi:hypothetical protein